jgi:AcrR family transcriptional regulator
VPRKKLLSDAAVLAAAGRVFARIGAAHFTLADVAEEAGLAPATLLQRFGSKRSLTLAFAEHAAALVRRCFEQARDEVSEPLGALRSALLLVSRTTKSRQALIHSLVFLLADLADEELRQHAARHARWVDASIRELLDIAMAQGALAPTDTTRLAFALQAAWNGAFIQWAIRGRGVQAEWIGAAIDTLMRPYMQVPALT